MSGASAVLSESSYLSHLTGFTQSNFIPAKMNPSLKRPVSMEEFLSQMDRDQQQEKKARRIENENTSIPNMDHPNYLLPQPFNYPVSSPSSLNLFTNSKSFTTVERPQLPPLKNLHLPVSPQRQEQQPLCPPFSKLMDSLSEELNQEYSKNHLWQQSKPAPSTNEIPRLPNPLDILASAVSKKETPAPTIPVDSKKEGQPQPVLTTNPAHHVEQIPRITLPRSKGTSSKTWYAHRLFLMS